MCSAAAEKLWFLWEVLIKLGVGWCLHWVPSPRQLCPYGSPGSIVGTAVGVSHWCPLGLCPLVGLYAIFTNLDQHGLILQTCSCRSDVGTVPNLLERYRNKCVVTLGLAVLLAWIEFLHGGIMLDLCMNMRWQEPWQQKLERQQFLVSLICSSGLLCWAGSYPSTPF